MGSFSVQVESISQESVIASRFNFKHVVSSDNGSSFLVSDT